MFGSVQVPPEPVLLLDEIDAPLDDANIGRFIEMLRSMWTRRSHSSSRKPQDQGDRQPSLWVTMEEPGVSKLISISCTENRLPGGVVS